MVVLFLCTGNSCRSPMAEGILKAKIAASRVFNIRVESAGVMVPPGISVSANSVKAAMEHGIDISLHIPRQVTRDMIDRSDLIFVMELAQKALLLSVVPEAQSHIFLLKEYCNSTPPGEIDDPIGLDIEVYKSIFFEIEREIDRILPCLKYADKSRRQ